MSEFRTSCPGCGQRLACDDYYLGRQINCPTCTMLIQLPDAGAFADLGSMRPSLDPGIGLGTSEPQSAPTTPRLRLRQETARQPAYSRAAGGEFELGADWRSEEGSLDENSEHEQGTGILGMYEQLERTAKKVKALPEFKQARPSRMTGLNAFFARAGTAIRLMCSEKELITFALLQWSVIGIVYFVWVQVLDWIPEETWAAARRSDGVSAMDVAFLVWSLLCTGLAAFPLGILSGCMGVVHFLNRRGEESTIARCLKIVMPQAMRLWLFTWIDAAITCRQILERLPKKRDADSRPVNRAVSEALYHAWKLGTAGMLPGLILGKGMVAAGKESLLLVKNRFRDMALLRGGYSALCWVVGVLSYVGGVGFFLMTGFFDKTQGLNQGVQIHQFYQVAGVPILMAAGVVLVFLRPLFLISLCDLYAEETEQRGESIQLAESPGSAALPWQASPPTAPASPNTGRW